MNDASTRPTDELSDGDRKWLYERYLQLSSDEGQLAGVRTSYSATIGAVLLTGLVIAIAGLFSHPWELALVATVLSLFGLFQAVAWSLMLHHTLEAQAMWRAAAYQLEQQDPPVRSRVPGNVVLPGGSRSEVDLARPYSMHRERFALRKTQPPFTRLRPATVMESLPIGLVILWIGVVAAVWIWFFFGMSATI